MPAGLTQERLSHFKSSMTDRLLEPPKSLSDAAARAWLPIRQHTYAFDKRFKKAQVLQQVTLSDLLELYDTHIYPNLAAAAMTQQAVAAPAGTEASHQDMLAVAGVSNGDIIPAGSSMHRGGSSRTLCCELWGARSKIQKSKAVAPDQQAAAADGQATATTATAATSPPPPPPPEAVATAVAGAGGTAGGSSTGDDGALLVRDADLAGFKQGLPLYPAWPRFHTSPQQTTAAAAGATAAKL